ncbi:retrovirus-related pol polyprotein from transposon TNT 1-94 [Tanacetum coccineum]
MRLEIVVTLNTLFYINELKSQSQEKNTVIRKLKDRIKSFSGKDSVENVKKDIDDTETKNIELEHSFCHYNIENELRKLKGKNIVDTAVSTPIATTIAPGMFQINLEPLTPKLLKNRDVHMDYIKHSKDHEDILREIVKNARALSPLDSNLDSACNEKLVAVTPMNKVKKVTFSEPITSSSNILKQTDSLKTKYSYKSLLPSTGVNFTTSASGSKPSGNTKRNRIMRPPSSNHKNKVEEHPRKVKSSLNNMNVVSEPISDAPVKHSVRNAQFESIYAICNECLFDANHDKCVLDYVHDVNVLSKSKNAKCKNIKRKEWKPTGMVFTEIGYKWKHTGCTFTIVRKRCPLVRFTSTKVVPTKETTIKSVLTPNPGIIVYSRRPIATRYVGSTVFDVLSSSLIDCRLSKFVSAYYEEVGISHQTSVARTLQHNSVVERRNCTLLEVARTMLIFSKALLFLWAEAVATACYTQNRSLIQKGHNKTPYELLHDRKPDLSYLHVFGALCYPTNDGEDFGNLKPKADIGIFVGYAPAKKAL